MTTLQTQLSIMVADHGLISVIRALVDVCIEKEATAQNRFCWRRGRVALCRATDALDELFNIPGITGPFSEVVRISKLTPTGSVPAQPKVSSRSHN